MVIFFCNGYNVQWKIKTKRTLTYCVSKEENLSYELFFWDTFDCFTTRVRTPLPCHRENQLFRSELVNSSLKLSSYKTEAYFFMTQVTFTDPCCVFPFVGVCSARNPLNNRAVCFCKDVCVILWTHGTIHDHGKPLTTT